MPPSPPWSASTGLTSPPRAALPDYVHNLGFVSKTTQEGRRRLDELFGSSHLLILPSRAEACAMVLAEANAYGLPCAATNVGGIPTAIRDESNGLIFDL